MTARHVDDETGRISVTVAEFAASSLNGECTGYLYREGAGATDPWRLVDAVDLATEPAATHADVWMVSGACLSLPLTARLYVLPAHLPSIDQGPLAALAVAYGQLVADRKPAGDARRIYAAVSELAEAARRTEEWMGLQPLRTEPHGSRGAKLPDSELQATQVYSRLRSALAGVGGAP